MEIRRIDRMAVATRLAAFGLLVAAAFLAGWTLVGGDRAQAQTEGEWAEIGDATAAFFVCSDIYNVGTFSGSPGRIHVRCSTSNGGIYYYAYRVDSAHIATADQMLAVLSSALALDKTVVLYYDSNSANNPSGCQISDCRGLTGVEVLR